MTRLRESVVAWAAGGDAASAAGELAEKLAPTVGLRTVVLVEGVSDQVALERLAVRRGHDLDAEGACVVPLGGATSIGRFVDVVGPQGLGAAVACLCDQAERRFFERALDGAGLGLGGLFACDPDLEGELITALGVAAVEDVIDREGERRAYDIFRQQPAQRDRTDEQRLHRFMGTHSGRKAHYGRALVDALDLGCVPKALDDLLAEL